MEVLHGDITKLNVDAIVNAANSSLLGGGGVDGAIHKAGGPKILAECVAIRNRQGGCATGEAVITTGGNLPARFVIHTVGPVWTGGDGNEKQLLRNAYENSLKLARDNNLKSIAFPNISTGVYRFPKTDAATIAVNTVRNFIRENSAPEKIIFCCFDKENFELYKSLIS
jgi:O-acetyl-ADP-ribose deacetylase (regulator of RNase III)